MRRPMVALALLAGVTVHAQDAPPVLTLSDAVSLALRNDSRIQAAVDAVQDAKIARHSARLELRPKVTPHVLGALGGANSVSNQHYGVDVLQRLPGGAALEANVGSSSARNQLGTFYFSDTTLSLTQPLYGAGRDAYRAAAEAAGRRVEEAIEERNATSRRVAVDVARAYYAIVSQRQLVEMARTSVDRAQRLLDVSKAKLEIGKVSQLDVLRAEQFAREAESQLLDAQASAEDAMDDLRVLTGRELGDAFTVDARLPAEPPASEPPDTGALTAALARRPELLRAKSALAEAERNAQTARRPIVPRVDLQLALTRRETGGAFKSSFGLDGFRVVPFLGVSLPFADGSAAATRGAALLDVDRRRREVATIETTLELEARRAIRLQQRLARALDEANASVEFAHRQVDVARTRFERGLSNNLDVVSAEGDLLTAESRRISAAAALAVATLNVQATLATLDPANDFKN